MQEPLKSIKKIGLSVIYWEEIILKELQHIRTIQGNFTLRKIKGYKIIIKVCGQPDIFPFLELKKKKKY